MDPLSVDGATVSERLLFASDFTTAFGADLRLRRLADRGSLHRVRRGVYIDEAVWRVLGPRDKYAAVVRGAALVPRQENVLSHHSAAVIWNLVRDGLQVTTIERTVVDLATVLDLKSAVAVVDRALFAERFGRIPTLTTKAKLRETWERMLPFRGSVREIGLPQGRPWLSGA